MTRQELLGGVLPRLLGSLSGAKGPAPAPPTR